MRHVTQVHLEGTEHLEHISKLHWYESAGPNTSDLPPLMVSSRAEMYSHIKGGGKGFTVSKTDNTHAYLIPVEGQHVNYVKTAPDSVKSDNLLSLPRF